MSLKPFIACLLLPFCCFALTPYVPKNADPVLEPWRWREMTELGGHGVRCVDEAPDGSLWFGGIGGLMRYDGMRVEWMPFDKGLETAIDFNLPREPWCYNVLCLPDGSLLAVIESTLLQWKDGKWTVLQKGLGGAEYESRLVQADDGTIWLFRPNSLRCFSPDLSRQEVVLEASKHEHFSSFCLDGKGDAWVLADRPSGKVELVHIPVEEGRALQRMQWECYPFDGMKPVREANICAGPNGKIWYVDSKGNDAIHSFDPQQGGWTELNDPNSRTGYFSLFKDHAGTLWAGGAGSLFSIRGDERKFFTSLKLGLPSLPLAVFEAGNGTWWVVIRGGYVYQMVPGDRQWKTFFGLHFECEAADGTQWFLDSKHGVISYHPNTGQWNIYEKSETRMTQVRSLFVSNQGLVWALGRSAGRAAFSVFDGKQWTRYDVPEVGNAIGEGSYLEAADGTVWLGGGGDRISETGSGGALRYEVKDGKPQLLKHYTDKEFPRAINCFAQTPDGTVWLGAPQIYGFMPGRDEKATLIPNLPNTFTYDMVADAKGDLWIAKGLFGIFRKTADGWRQYVEDDDLKGKVFVDLLPLPDGTLLAASGRGINRFDGNVWSVVFPMDFGMSSRNCSMQRSKDGSLWFNYAARDSRSPRVIMNLAEEEGFYTVRYVADTQAPDTFLEQLPREVDSLGNISVSWSGRDPWENTPKDQLQYSWRLNKGEWSPFSFETSHTFLGLNNGDCVLEVRARDRDFNMDETPASGRFTVLPPVWRRPWLIALELLVVFGTVAFVWMAVHYHERGLRDRARDLENMDRMKTSFFTNMSHELNTPLGLIRGLLEWLMESDQDSHRRNLLDMAMGNVQRASTLVSQLMDFRKLEEGLMRLEVEEGDISETVRKGIAVLKPMADRLQIRCELECGETCRGWFDPDKLDKIVFNLVGNAIKYSPSGAMVRVVLQSRTDDGNGRTLVLVVEDTGIGIAPENLSRIFDRFYRVPARSIVNGSGIGLNLTKELVDLWGGQIRVESPIHADADRPGTRFVVELPISLEHIPNRG